MPPVGSAGAPGAAAAAGADRAAAAAAAATAGAVTAAGRSSATRNGAPPRPAPLLGYRTASALPERRSWTWWPAGLRYAMPLEQHFWRFAHFGLFLCRWRQFAISDLPLSCLRGQ
jgi:hypothetical protein